MLWVRADYIVSNFNCITYIWHNIMDTQNIRQVIGRGRISGKIISWNNFTVCLGCWCLVNWLQSAHLHTFKACMKHAFGHRLIVPLKRPFYFVQENVCTYYYLQMKSCAILIDFYNMITVISKYTKIYSFFQRSGSVSGRLRMLGPTDQDPHFFRYFFKAIPIH